MGAHPKAPSLAQTAAGPVPLNELIAGNPAGMLGEQTAEAFGDLPFLFKYLAAGQPLSIQAHPDKVQAEEGFNRENSMGIPPGAPERNYRDRNHKPEIITALTPFWALRGFRRVDEIISLAGELGVAAWSGLAAAATEGLRPFFEGVMKYSDPGGLAAAVIRSAAEKEGDIYRWIIKLNQVHPGDIGVLAPLFLNLVKLNPGEAMFLPRGGTARLS